MRKFSSLRRGAILLQTLIMCMVLAFIAISVTRWVLNRYMGATRTTRSSQARGVSHGGAMFLFSNWNTTANPANPSPLNISGKSLPYSYNGTTKKVTFTYDEEQ